MGKHKKSPSMEAPTPERLTKGDDIVPYETEDAGVFAHQNATECQLDRMYHQGRLGDQEHEGKRRYDAGMWLRKLYLKTHPTEGVMGYHDAGKDQGEMTDQMAWNLKCFMDTARHMGLYWRHLDQVCCMNCGYGTVDTLLEALDALADHRGM